MLMNFASQKIEALAAALEDTKTVSLKFCSHSISDDFFQSFLSKCLPHAGLERTCSAYWRSEKLSQSSSSKSMIQNQKIYLFFGWRFQWMFTYRLCLGMFAWTREQTIEFTTIFAWIAGHVQNLRIQVINRQFLSRFWLISHIQYI